MTDFTACSKELKTLGLQPRVTWNDVQAAYRRLAMQLHPDRRLQKRDEEGQEHVDRFRQINEAYERLRRYHAEERMRSKEHLFRICTDPAAASLEIEELELRLERERG